MQYKSYLVENNFNILKQNFVLIYGINLGLKNDFKSVIKKNNPDAEIITLFEEEIINKKDLLINELTNLSLFERKKIFLINEITDKFYDIVQEVLNYIKDNKIYLFSNMLEKKSKIRGLFEKDNNLASIACYEDNEIGLRKIISTKLNQFSGLTTNTINMIIDKSNLDRARLNNEIEKIKCFFDNKKIDENKLENLLNLKINDKFDEIKDEALKGNKIKTNKLLSESIIEGEKSLFYLSSINLIINKINELNKIQGDNLEEKVNNLKPQIFWKDKPNFIIQSKKWSEEKISKLHSMTYDFELKTKTSSTINKAILIKKLIVDICELSNA